MDDNVVLRGSLFGGFNRNDVLRYVDTLQARIGKAGDQVKVLTEKLEVAEKAKEELEAYSSALTQAQSENEQLRGENQDLTEKYTTLKEAYDKLQEDLAVAIERAQARTEQSAEQRNRYDQLMRALTRSESENSQLRRELESVNEQLRIQEDRVRQQKEALAKVIEAFGTEE